MLYFNFTIENNNKAFLITKSKTTSLQDYQEFNIYNYKSKLTKPDLLIYYKNNNGKDIYKKITENIHILSIYDRNKMKFEFKLFTTSSILTISTNVISNVNIYIDNRKLENTTTTLIVPKYTALNCWFEIIDTNTDLSYMEIIFSYPIYLKRYTTIWSII